MYLDVRIEYDFRLNNTDVNYLRNLLIDSFSTKCLIFRNASNCDLLLVIQPDTFITFIDEVDQRLPRDSRTDY